MEDEDIIDVIERRRRVVARDIPKMIEQARRLLDCEDEYEVREARRRLNLLRSLLKILAPGQWPTEFDR